MPHIVIRPIDTSCSQPPRPDDAQWYAVTAYNGLGGEGGNNLGGDEIRTQYTDTQAGLTATVAYFIQRFFNQEEV